MKWIAAAAVVALAVLALLLREVMSDSEAPADPVPVPVVVKAPADAAQSVAVTVSPDAGAAVPSGDAAPAVFVPKSTEFWERADHYQKTRLLGYVADCYKGGKDRKAKLKLTYQLVIQNHQVTVRDLRIVDTSFGDEDLEQCMVRSLEAAQFVDKEMPDFRSDPNDPEELLIRIENLKRFYPDQDEGMK